MSKLSRSLGRSGNPALTSEVFNKSITSQGEVMTLQGTVNKTAFSLFLLVVSGAFTFNMGYTNPDLTMSLIWPGFIGGFIVALVTIFKKTWSPITVPIYSVLEGLALGGVSFLYDQYFYDGIASQAIILTVSIFAALLFAYKTRIIKPTANFKLGIFAATGGIALVYIIHWIMVLVSGGNAGMPIMDPTNASLLSIGFSLFVVAIAALNLVLDFDIIEQAAENRTPKYMEWFGAMALVATLIWLYLEILRLLAKLRS